MNNLALNLMNPEMIAQAERKTLDLPQVECSVSHHFGPGIYIREVRIPAGTFSIGHHQNVEHLNHMVTGRVLMLADDGTVKELVAPVIYTAKPGRKVGVILEDMVWHNIYPTDETDIEKLEATYLTKSDDWKNSNEAKQKIEYLKRHSDREDYDVMLKDLGVTRALVRTQSENEKDQIPMPKGSFNVMVSDSQIEGKGVFATSTFAKGQPIAPARIKDKRTPVGRYTNHSPNPNAAMEFAGNGVILVALREIQGCHGGESGEEITVDYRQVRSL